MHICTEEDYKKFWPVDSRSQHRMDLIRTDPNRNLLCIDWETAGIDFYGLEESGTFSELDVAIVPCNLKNTMIGGETDSISEECIPDLQK